MKTTWKQDVSHGQVDDYIVKAEAEGVKETAAIRVAATLIPENITGDREPQRKAVFAAICY